MTGPDTEGSPLEAAIGRVLRAGSAVSTVGFAGGLLLALMGDPGGLSRGLLTAGLVVLVATPVTRVVLSVVEYLRQRDWAFVVYTLIVLGALVGSLVVGFGGRR
jgi:uncharacterized membrane protein